ncbi:MAG: hypothetical protein R2695_04215 [Acidimicrobiales bacterium]
MTLPVICAAVGQAGPVVAVTLASVPADELRDAGGGVDGDEVDAEKAGLVRSSGVRLAAVVAVEVEAPVPISPHG